jgi:hypothetical protein
LIFWVLLLSSFCCFLSVFFCFFSFQLILCAFILLYYLLFCILCFIIELHQWDNTLIKYNTYDNCYVVTNQVWTYCFLSSPPLLPYSCGEGRIISPDGKGCVDKNECLDAPCHNGGVCINQDPRLKYRCICPENFWGENCELVQEGQTLKLSMGALAAILVCLLIILSMSHYHTTPFLCSSCYVCSHAVKFYS